MRIFKVDMCSGCHAGSTTDYLHLDPPTAM